MKNTKILTGHDAIEHAEVVGGSVTLNKYADPVEGARCDVTVDEAIDIAQEDPALVWIEVEVEV